MTRQPDIEIYVSDIGHDRLVTWVESRLGAMSPLDRFADVTVYESTCGVVVITPGIEGGPFTSVWFTSPDAPWASDVDCARAAAADLECVVRCEPGEAFPEVSPFADVFFESNGQSESLVLWGCSETRELNQAHSDPPSN